MVTPKSQIRTVKKPVQQTSPKQPSVAVNARTGMQDGTSTYRQEAAGSVTVKGSNGSITVARSTKPQVDLRQNSISQMNQPSPQPISTGQPQANEQSSLNMAESSNPQMAQASSSPHFQDQNPAPLGSEQGVVVPQDGQRATYYGVDPNYSVISQTGSYQYPFFTSEGQAERVQNALDTLNPFRMSSTLIGGKYRKGLSEATTGLVWAANVAAVLNAAGAVFQTVRGMATVGATAATVGGAEALAGANLAATGVSVTYGPTTIGVAANTANLANQIKMIAGIPAAAKNAATLGGVITLTGAASTIGKSSNDRQKVKEETIKYLKDSGDLAVELREVGLTDLADEIDAGNRDLLEGLKSTLPYVPFMTKNAKLSELQDYVQRLDEITRSYKAKVKADNEREIEEALAEERKQAQAKELQDQMDMENKRSYERNQEREQRRYNEAQEKEQRAYNEARLAESRAYSESQRAQEILAEGAGTQAADPSSLKFGLLHPGSATEFVDRDKASQFYFQKPYAELSPEQLMLLNKLKEEKE